MERIAAAEMQIPASLGMTSLVSCDHQHKGRLQAAR